MIPAINCSGTILRTIRMTAVEWLYKNGIDSVLVTVKSSLTSKLTNVNGLYNREHI